MIVHPHLSDHIIILQKTNLEDKTFRWDYIAWNSLFGDTYSKKTDHFDFLVKAKELWDIKEVKLKRFLVKKEESKVEVVGMPILETKELKTAVITSLEETKGNDIFLTREPTLKENNVTVAPQSNNDTEYEEEEEEEESEEELHEGGSKDKKSKPNQKSTKEPPKP